MAWHSLPMLTHMNRHAPSMQPMQAVMERAMKAEAQGDILNASLFGCFPAVGYTACRTIGDRGRGRR